MPSPIDAVKGLANGKHEKLIKILESIDNIGSAGETGHGALKSTRGKAYSNTTKVCPDCFPGDRSPEYGTDAYELDPNRKVIDTLKRNEKSGKVDTFIVK